MGIWTNPPGFPGVAPRGKPLIDALLLQKTGNWPVHDIKSFAIGTFLSWLLLKEQMMISKKIYIYLCERIWDRKASRSFEQKISGFKSQHLQVVGVSVVVIVAQANTHNFPPPPKLAKFPSCFSTNVREISTIPISFPRPTLVMNGLRNKRSWSGLLFLSLPQLFFLQDHQQYPILTNRIFKKVKVWITLEA